MNISVIRKSGWFFFFLMIVCTMASQQYTVTGGSKEVCLATDDSRERIKVFLVYGMDNVQISYSSSSATHKWYRYRTRVSDDSEEIPSVQTGTTSVISDIKEGYGYYVVDENVNVINRYYVWVFDYGKYAFDIRSLNVSTEVDECVALRFSGDADIRDMVYHTILGAQESVKREYVLIYETLEWNEATKHFSNIQFRDTFNTDPFSTSFPPTLSDTEITLTGDMFARHFGIEKSISVPYKAVAIKVYADTTIVSSGSSNMSESSEGVLHAPAVIRFNAYTNTPVASRFSWRVFAENDTISKGNYNMEELVYTFNEAGTFIIKLEVNSSICSNMDEDEELRTFIVNVTETEMTVPNAFSPGCTPGINDIFKVRYKSVIKFQGWVFNRWGNELFRWTDPSQGWDGKYRGKYVPPGAYLYLIEYTGTDRKNYKKKGEINVFRSKEINDEIPDEE